MKYVQSFIIICLLLLLSSHSILAASKVALVIGNSRYDTDSWKKPANNDATDIATLLMNAGFDVILRTDTDKRAILKSIEEFGRKLPQAEIGLFYFAGPGISLTHALMETRLNVAAETSLQQISWESSSLMQKVFIMAGNQASSPMYGDIWKEPVTGMEFVWVPRGCFKMGQTETEKDYLIKDAGQETYDTYYKVELPRHEVYLDGFWMGKTEVTRGQFRQFIRSEEYKTDADKKDTAKIMNKETEWKWKDLSGHNWEKAGYSQTDTHPVVNVSWNDAKAFIKWLSRETDQNFVLPTEAQWEYAARGGTTGMRFWGSNDADACRYANVADKGNNWKNSFPCSDGYRFTAPAANYYPNPFGLHDMLGNVWEWCEDVYDSNAYSKHARNNPVITSGGSARVIRGGSWNDRFGGMRATNRYGVKPDNRGSLLGFRLALSQIRQ